MGLFCFDESMASSITGPAIHLFPTQYMSSFDPSCIGGCSLWIDATNSFDSSITAGVVSSIYNKATGSSYNGGGGGWTRTANALNGKPAFTRSSGSNQGLLVNGTLTSITLPISFFIVSSLDTSATTPVNVFTIASTTVQQKNNTTSPQFSQLVVVDSSSNSTIISQTSKSEDTTATPTLWSGTIQTNTITTSKYTNPGGTQFTDIVTTTPTTNLPATASTNIYIGSNSGGNSNSFIGSISEILVYNRTLSDNEIIQIEGYLAHKWNLTSVLPSQHFYEKSLTNSIRPFLRPFVPTDIDGCYIWLDGADTSTFTFGGMTTNIRTWTDKASNISFSRKDVNATSELALGADSRTRQGQSVLFAPANNGNACFISPNLTGTIAENTTNTVTFFAVCRSYTRVYPAGQTGSRLVSVTNITDNTTIDTGDSGAYISYLLPTAGAGSEIPGYTSNAAGRLILSSIHPAYTGVTWQLTPKSISTGTGNSALKTDVFYIVSFSLDTTNTTTTPKNRCINGTPCVEPTTTKPEPTDIPTHSYKYITIGNEKNSTGTDCWEGAINEVIFYKKVLSDTERQQVEGYLAWKWGLRNGQTAVNDYCEPSPALPTTHNFYKKPPFSVSPFTPKSIGGSKSSGTFSTNLVAWFDASDANSFTSISGTAFTRWKDKVVQSGGTTNYLSYIDSSLTEQTSDTNGITIAAETSTLNNLPSVNIAPTVTTAAGLQSNVLFNTSSFKTVFAVFSVSTWNVTYTNSRILSIGTEAGGVQYNYQLGLDGTPSPNIKAQVRGTSSATTTVIASSSSVIPNIVATTYDDTRVLTTFVNGTAFGPSGQTIAPTSNSTDRLFIAPLCSGATPAASKFNGRICELIFLNVVLSTNQRQLVEGYLSWKWSTKLAKTHPYYAVRP